jgi:hypothetical protein
MSKLMKGIEIVENTPKESQVEKEWDEFFALHREESDASGSDKDEIVINPEDSEDAVMAALSGGADANRKSNVQDEMEIAESIICGISQYQEIDVRAHEQKPADDR